MIQEDYCSFEIAKLLKEKGFDEPCLQIYTSDGKRYNMHSTCYQNVCDDDECLAPTHQMACDWLRKEHLLHIHPEHKAFFQERPKKIYFHWMPFIKPLPYCKYKPTMGTNEWELDMYCDSYEEAVEAALKYSLENLI